MPECYTHCYTALQALGRSGQVAASRPAFLAGANGPDVLRAHSLWGKNKYPEFAQLSQRMHTEKTGLFLLTLLQLAATPVQQSYVMGYLAHYGADCVMHPYVEAMCSGDGPYAGRRLGKMEMKNAMDSELYNQDYRTRLVPVHAGSPVLITGELGQVVSLLQNAIETVYGISLNTIALADNFHDNLRMRKYFISRYGIKKKLAPLLEKLMSSSWERGELHARMQPASPLQKLPTHWVHPYSKEERDQSFEELLLEARDVGVVYITAAMQFWLGEMNEQQIEILLGNRDCTTSLPLLDPSTAKSQVSAEAVSGQQDAEPSPAELQAFADAVARQRDAMPSLEGVVHEQSLA